MNRPIFSGKIVPLSGAALSGILLALPWLGFPGYVLFIAFVPLIGSISYPQSRLNNGDVAWTGPFITFLIWNSLATWWISKVSITGAVIIVFLNSLLMTLVFVSGARIQKRLGSWIGKAALLTFWLSFEYLHFHWELSWPWLTLGNGLANLIGIIQWYEFTGVLGGSAWILLSNLLICNLLFSNYKKLTNWLWLSILMIVPLGISYLLYYKDIKGVVEKINIGVIQPNIDPVHQKYNNLSPGNQLDILINLADSLDENQVCLYLGPETALHQIDEGCLDENMAIQKLRDFLASGNPDAAWIIGAISFKKHQEDSPSGFSGPVYDGVRYFNSAFFIDTTSTKMYHKAKLVSGVEKMPFARYFTFLEHMKIQLEGEAHLFSTGNQGIVFQHDDFKIAIPICYESVYGEYLGTFVKSGANLFVLITNDGWWDQTPGYKQHLMMSRLRAIEHRRWMVRSANTGISALIDDKGRYLKKTEWWKRMAFIARAELREKKTFYSLHGDYIGKISLWISIAFLIATLTKIIRTTPL